jgi:hypothetical protein
VRLGSAARTSTFCSSAASVGSLCSTVWCSAAISSMRVVMRCWPSMSTSSESSASSVLFDDRMEPMKWVCRSADSDTARMSVSSFSHAPMSQRYCRW